MSIDDRHRTVPDVLGARRSTARTRRTGRPAPSAPGHGAGTPAERNAGSIAATAFGRVITPMVTPFDEAGRVDDTAAEQLAGRLTRDGWNDAVLVNGTPGEAGATDDVEKRRMIVAARRAVSGTGRKVIAGVGSGSTAHSVRLAVEAHAAGADGLFVAAPYAGPSQSGLLEHFRAVADATPLPVMLCDNPQYTGVALEPDTLRAAALHPRIIAVQDAKGNLGEASSVMRSTQLAFYSGDDMLNLPWLSVGATGVVSVAGHVVGDRLQTLLRLHDEGRNAEATALHRQLLPIYAGMYRAPAAASVKAALRALGLPGGSVRLPLMDLTEEQHREIRSDLVSTVTELGFSMERGAQAAPAPPRVSAVAGARRDAPAHLAAS